MPTKFIGRKIGYSIISLITATIVGLPWLGFMAGITYFLLFQPAITTFIIIGLLVLLVFVSVKLAEIPTSRERLIAISSFQAAIVFIGIISIAIILMF